jgi:ATP-dependent DNA helicase PIF1
MLQNCMAAQKLELKVNAQVMLIKNMDENLVNGSLGKVIGFMTDVTYLMCEQEKVDVEDALHFDAAADDPYGFKTLDDENEDSKIVARKKKRIINLLQAMAADTSQLWPLVRFTTTNGMHIDRLMTKEKCLFELPDGEVQAYHRQVPLILAYAISIHKAQGQTLSCVRVDLG